jgi:predicted nucleic acid-binding protein
MKGMLAGAVFIDTGGWIAVAVSKEQYHSAATDCYRDLLAQDFPLVTSGYVLDENQISSNSTVKRWARVDQNIPFPVGD